MQTSHFPCIFLKKMCTCMIHAQLTPHLRENSWFFPAQAFSSAIHGYKFFLITKLSEAASIFHPKRNLVKELLALLPVQLAQLCTDQQCFRWKIWHFTRDFWWHNKIQSNHLIREHLYNSFHSSSQLKHGFTA